MLTLLFAVCMIGVFGKLFQFSVKAAWGVAKVLLTLVVLPILLVVMVLGGLITVAFPVLILIGIVVLIRSAIR